MCVGDGGVWGYFRVGVGVLGECCVGFRLIFVEFFFRVYGFLYGCCFFVFIDGASFG